MSNDLPPTTLEVDSISISLRGREVLDDVRVRLGRDEVVAVVGHNGAGKSTLLKSIMGLLPVAAGDIIFEGRSILQLTPAQRWQIGLGYVPQKRGIFGELTVEENLRLSVMQRPARLTGAEIVHAVERGLTYFPSLIDSRRRVAGGLSGGTKRQLAFACALLRETRVLLLDEPSIGLSEDVVPALFQTIARFAQELRVGILLVEHRIEGALSICERLYALRRGRVVLEAATRSIDKGELMRVLFR